MFNFLFLLILLGSLQGIIMGFVLYFGKPRHYSNRLLAVLIWIIAMPGIHLYLHYKGFFNGARIADLTHALVPWMMISATGSILFFYLRSLLDAGFRVSWKHCLWFLPLVIDVLPKLFEVAFVSGLIPTSAISNRTSFEYLINLYNQYADLPRWIAVACGVSASHRLLHNYYKQSIDLKNPNPQLIGWLRQFVNVFAVFMGVWFIYLIPYLLPQTSEILTKTVGWFPVYIPMAIMIYWLGFKGMRSSAILMNPLPDKKIKAAPMPQMQEIVDRLLVVMQNQKPYLDPSLDLASFSVIAGIPAKQISSALNQQVGKSFSSFLNEYRVGEFMDRADDTGTITIAALASNCGFSSLATFQRVFKQSTGQTPSEYLRKKAS